uniref:uncharacterized protein LOC122604117 n=1 Tax=Erigeron canadensis TaxID=72917 RepID=UPI001CB8CA45|nr:uncharacterized protein LOC122604117 [Erigeron canadensis]
MAKKVNDGNNVKEERIQWNVKMDVVFIEAMRKEHDDGNRIGGTFTSLAYSNMVNYLKEHLQREFTKEHLMNRLKTLKLHFSQCYDLFRGLMMRGFAWNSETNLIEAEEELWETLIKEKPEAAKWKNKQICHYEELLYLFAEDRATGASAITTKERKNMLNNGKRVETIEEIDQLLESDVIVLETPPNIDNIHAATTTKPSKENLPTIKAKNKKKRKPEEEEDFQGKVMSSIKDVAEAIRENTKVMKSSRPHVYFEEEIYIGLESMDLAPNEIRKVYLYLVEHPGKTRALFGCPYIMRREMLEEMMTASDSNNCVLIVLLSM